MDGLKRTGFQPDLAQITMARRGQGSVPADELSRRLGELIRIAKYAGERFDLIQAGGGNASVKLSDGSMLIKASGCRLSEVEFDSGFATVDMSKLLRGMARASLTPPEKKEKREALSRECLADASTSNVRPSMETYLHLPLHRYTLHTHPLVVNAIACRRDWREVLGTLFPRASFVDYRTPGIELGLELSRVVSERRRENAGAPRLIFLKNHGLIVSSDRFEDIQRITERVLKTIEKHLKVSMAKYKLTTRVSSLLRAASDGYPVSLLCEDGELTSLLRSKRELFFKGPFCPDGLVYCGAKPLRLRSLRDRKSLSAYKSRCRGLPRVVVYGNRLFFVAQNIRKAREIEELFKFHITALSLSEGPVDFLPREELLYLGQLESERYRRQK